MNRVVWHNGVLIPESEARVSIYDSALMFGDMVFEMTRSFNKVHFKLDEHLDRLFRSAELTHQSVPYTKDELKAAIELVTAENAKTFQPDDEHRLLINVSRGTLGLYAGRVDAPVGPQVMIADFPLRWTVAGMGRLFEEGVKAKTVEAVMPAPEAKHRSRLGFILANHDVSPDWAICFRDHDGVPIVTEGPGYNVCFVERNGRFSIVAHDCLSGISQRTAIGIVGIPFYAASMRTWDLPQMAEIFFTATPFCALPVVEVDGHPVGDGKPGPVYRKLLSQWSENVGLHIAAQIRSWDAQPSTQTVGVTPYQFSR